MRETEMVASDIGADKGSGGIPEIYGLIEAKAATEKIVQQIFSDFYTDPSREKVYLGVEELLQRGLEGRAALQWMATDTGEAGAMARRVLEQPEIAGQELEKTVGMENRFGNTLLEENVIENAREVYIYAKTKGYLEPFPEVTDMNSFLKVWKRQLISEMNGGPIPPQISGDIERELVLVSATFGGEVPTYLELNGPREILRVRSKEKSNILLLGTLGQYSAREFARYAKKLSRTAMPSVIDINHSVTTLSRFTGENGLQIVRGNAASLPFADGSVDQIYTNFLFHALTNPERRMTYKEGIGLVMDEAVRALCPSGSLVLYEKVYGPFQEGDGKKAKAEVISLALKAGLRLKADVSDTQPTVFFRSDVMGGKYYIDDNGFGQYGDTLIIKGETESSFSLRFVKE